MKFTIIGKKITVTDKLRSYAERKISKLDKYFRDEAEANVVFSVERGRVRAEVTIKSGEMFYRVSETTSDKYASIDSAVTGIERQIHKYKTRLEKQLRSGSLDDIPVADFDDEPQEDEPPIEIVRSKRFALKPMTAEEACMQMELLNHQFYAFRNQDDNNAFSVVYRRSQGGYGLIESQD